MESSTYINSRDLKLVSCEICADINLELDPRFSVESHDICDVGLVDISVSVKSPDIRDIKMPQKSANVSNFFEFY